MPWLVIVNIPLANLPYRAGAASVKTTASASVDTDALTAVHRERREPARCTQCCGCTWQAQCPSSPRQSTWPRRAVLVRDRHEVGGSRADAALTSRCQCRGDPVGPLHPCGRHLTPVRRTVCQPQTQPLPPRLTQGPECAAQSHQTAARWHRRWLRWLWVGWWVSKYNTRL